MKEHRHALPNWLFATATLVLAAALPVAAGAQAPYIPPSAPPAPLGGARVTGEATSINGNTLELTLRGGQTIQVDLSGARATSSVPPIYPGEFLQVQGKLVGTSVLTAVAVTHAKSAPAAWSPDVP